MQDFLEVFLARSTGLVGDETALGAAGSGLIIVDSTPDALFFEPLRELGSIKAFGQCAGENHHQAEHERNELLHKGDSPFIFTAFLTKLRMHG